MIEVAKTGDFTSISTNCSYKMVWQTKAQIVVLKKSYYNEHTFCSKQFVDKIACFAIFNLNLTWVVTILILDIKVKYLLNWRFKIQQKIYQLSLKYGEHYA